MRPQADCQTTRGRSGVVGGGERVHELKSLLDWMNSKPLVAGPRGTGFPICRNSSTFHTDLVHNREVTSKSLAHSHTRSRMESCIARSNWWG